MQSRKEKNGHWLILEKGEEIKSTISEWARKRKISGAHVWGIGAVEKIELGYYDERRKKYVPRKFAGSHELLSCIGNINEDGLHAHMIISKGDFIARGGHLLSAEISIFGEFFVLPTVPLRKEKFTGTPLRKISLGKK